MKRNKQNKQKQAASGKAQDQVNEWDPKIV